MLRYLLVTMANQTTYQSTLKNDAVINDMYHVLNRMGVEVGTNRKEILDSFLTNRRYFDTNIFSTVATGRKIKALPQKYKEGYVRAINHVDTMPSIFSRKGSAPKWKALKDYAFAGAADPTNLVSFIAGLGTAGVATAGIFSAKEAAKRGVAELFKAKTKAAFGKAGMKALGTEATISGVGGGLQAAGSQNVDIDLGRRKKYNLAEIGSQALLEGLATPTLGAGANILGSTALKAGKDYVVKPTGKIGKQLFPEITQATTDAAINLGNWIDNWLMPAAGLDNALLRATEKSQGELKEIKELAEKVSDEIEVARKKDFEKDLSGTLDPEDLDLINRAMVGDDPEALNAIAIRSTRMKDALNNWFKLRDMTLKEARKKRAGPSSKLLGIYNLSDNYIRDIYQQRTHARNTKRVPFEQWKNKKSVQKDLDDFRKAVLEDEALQIHFGLREGKLDKELNIVEKGELKDFADPSNTTPSMFETGKKLYDESTVNAIIERSVYDSYYTQKHMSKLGALKARRKDLAPIMKKILGQNYDPALRATETISGIIEPLTEIRMANNLSQALINKKMGVKASSLEEAIAIAKKEGMPDEQANSLVPLITTKYTKEYTDTPFKVGAKLAREDLYQVWIPAKLGRKLQMVTSRKGILTENWGEDSQFLGTIIQGFAAAQGYLKKAATVYNPFGQQRNVISMPIYAFGAGNWRGIGKFANKWITGSKAERDKFRDLARRMGITASNVELNQIAARLSEINNISPENAPGVTGWMTRRFVDLAGGFMPALERRAWFKKWARGAEKAYTKTDDIGKMITFMGERDKVQSIWDNFTPEQKQAAREEYWENFGEEIPKVRETKHPEILGEKRQKQFESNLENFDDDLLWEWAATKSLDIVPVYSRIPRIFEKMKDVPVGGSFMAFPAENARNTYKILKLGGEEIRDGFATGNKALVRAGYNRLVSKIAAASVPSIVAYGWNEYKDTNKYMDYVREQMPEWSKYHALKVRKDNKGKLHVSDLSYNNPDQYVLDMIMPFMISVANGEDVEKSLGPLFRNAVSKAYEPFLSKSLATQYGMNMMDYISADTDEGKARILSKIYKLVEPGIAGLVTDVASDLKANEVMDRLNEKLGGKGRFWTDWKRDLDPLYFGEKRKYFEDSATLNDYFAKIGLDPTNALTLYPFGLGAKEIEMDPKKSLGFAVGTLMRNATSDYNDATRSIRSDLLDEQNKTSLNSMLENLKEGIEEHYAAQQGIYKLVSSMSEFMSKEDIRKLLRSKKIKAAGSLSNKEIEMILKGRFAVPEFDQSFLKEVRQENKNIRKYIPRIRNQILKLQSKYRAKDLRDESLPEFTINKNTVGD